jgi:hypothetical protein
MRYMDRCLRLVIRAVIGIAALAAASAPAFAQYTYATDPGFNSPSEAISTLTSSNGTINATEAWGQIFTAPTSTNQIDSFSFWLSRGNLLAGDVLNYTARLYKINASLKAIGDAVFVSAIQNTPLSNTLVKTTFEIAGGRVLEAGATYIAALTTQDITTNIANGRGLAAGWTSNTANTGGAANAKLVFDTNTLPLKDATWQDYSITSNCCNFAFEANFSVVAVPVPAAGTGLPLVAALIGFLAWRNGRELARKAIPPLAA